MEENELERKLFQCGILKPQLVVVRSVIDAKLMEFKRVESTYKFTIGDTVSFIIREWGKENGYINGDTEPVNHLERIENNKEELQRLNDLVKAVNKTPNETNQRVLCELVLSVNPNYKGDSTADLLEEAQKILGVA